MYTTMVVILVHLDEIVNVIGVVIAMKAPKQRIWSATHMIYATLRNDIIHVALKPSVKFPKVDMSERYLMGMIPPRCKRQVPLGKFR